MSLLIVCIRLFTTLSMLVFIHDDSLSITSIFWGDLFMISRNFEAFASGYVEELIKMFMSELSPSNKRLLIQCYKMFIHLISSLYECSKVSKNSSEFLESNREIFLHYFSLQQIKIFLHIKKQPTMYVCMYVCLYENYRIVRLNQ